ncbi:hypothetical protein [uncultured Lamprocystis sp.]|nr:hypothetical protein [uncultured Lamprocystis sp.]
MDQRRYIANNSANVSQGDNQQNLIEGRNVTIGSTFSEKSRQIEKLDALLGCLEASKDSDTYKDVIRQIKNIKEELSDEEKPNEDLIEKWLNKAKQLVSFTEIGSDIFNKAKAVYESFGMGL